MLSHDWKVLLSDIRGLCGKGECHSIQYTNMVCANDGKGRDWIGRTVKQTYRDKDGGIERTVI